MKTKYKYISHLDDRKRTGFMPLDSAKPDSAGYVDSYTPTPQESEEGNLAYEDKPANTHYFHPDYHAREDEVIEAARAGRIQRVKTLFAWLASDVANKISEMSNLEIKLACETSRTRALGKILPKGFDNDFRKQTANKLRQLRLSRADLKTDIQDYRTFLHDIFQYSRDWIQVARINHAETLEAQGYSKFA